MEAGVDSSTLPVGMELDSGLRTIAGAADGEAPGGCPSLHSPCSERRVR